MFPRGDNTLKGVNSELLQHTYFWHPVNEASFCVEFLLEKHSEMREHEPNSSLVFCQNINGTHSHQTIRTYSDLRYSVNTWPWIQLSEQEIQLPFTVLSKLISPCIPARLRCVCGTFHCSLPREVRSSTSLNWSLKENKETVHKTNRSSLPLRHGI